MHASHICLEPLVRSLCVEVLAAQLLEEKAYSQVLLVNRTVQMVTIVPSLHHSLALK